MLQTDKVAKGILKDIEKREKGPRDIDVKEWILKNFPGPDEARLQICHLWDNYFRINYWLEIESNSFLKEERIILSKFLRIGEKELFQDNDK